METASTRTLPSSSSTGLPSQSSTWSSSSRDHNDDLRPRASSFGYGGGGRGGGSHQHNLYQRGGGSHNSSSKHDWEDNRRRQHQVPRGRSRFDSDGGRSGGGEFGRRLDHFRDAVVVRDQQGDSDDLSEKAVGRAGGDDEHRREQRRDWKKRDTGNNSQYHGQQYHSNRGTSRYGDRNYSRDGNWRREECGNKNFDNEYCRDYDTEPHRHKSNGNSDDRRNGSRYHRDEPRDNGRRSMDRHAHNRESDSPWPPPFDQAGALYVLDTRSGLFYEQASDFFYDPKTQLYFGNKAQSYFKYDPNTEPKFQPVQSVLNNRKLEEKNESQVTTTGALSKSETTASSDNADTKAEAGSTADKVDKSTKKAISFGISLSKKKTPQIKLDSAVSQAAAVASKNARVTSTESQKQVTVKPQHTLAVTSTEVGRKRHSSDISKWIERSNEASDQEGAFSRLKKQTTRKSVITSVSTNGKPVCLLCKRKFADMDKLRVHETKSVLHKENLVKAEAMYLQSNAEYKDRASQRRGMWGPSVDIAQDIGPTAREESRNEGNIMKARTVHAAAEVRPEENLGDDSVGNKMLKKLGWSKGENLGRGGDAGESGKFLKQDWEKIENLAAESAFPKPYGRAI